MARYTIDDLIDIHTYHAPSEEQLKSMQDIRDNAIKFAHAINTNAPDSADKSAALRKVREAQMTANAAIMLKGKV